MFYSIRGFDHRSVGPLVRWSLGLSVHQYESKSGKTRISAPAYPSATGGRVSGLVSLLSCSFLRSFFLFLLPTLPLTLHCSLPLAFHSFLFFPQALLFLPPFLSSSTLPRSSFFVASAFRLSLSRVANFLLPFLLFLRKWIRGYDLVSHQLRATTSTTVSIALLTNPYPATTITVSVARLTNHKRKIRI